MKDYIKQIIEEKKSILLKRSIVREYLQSRLLQILQEEKAFLNLAFLGGTSLRFLYSLPRYSEDLDFSKIGQGSLEFNGILSSIVKNFELENYNIKLKKSKEKTILSAFIKFPTLLYELDLSPHHNETLSVKIEIDTNPPAGLNTETTLIRKYVLLNIFHYDKPSLFAGKLHAILARKYVKGRDLFDLIWMLANPQWPPPNLILLSNSLEQTGWTGPELNKFNWTDIISRRIKAIDWKSSIDDTIPFLEREADKYLLTRDNCLNLLNQFHYK
jgi:hypothetical protein